MHGALAGLLSFLILISSYTLDQTIRWTDHLEGFRAALVHSLILLPFCAIFVLPYSLLVIGLYQWRKWRRFRTQWLVAPACLALIATLANLVVEPPTAANRFRRFAKAELPADARNLLYSASGGGFADYDDNYYFETSPAEVHRLLREMKFDPAKGGELGFSIISGAKSLNGPDPAAWTEARVYQRHNVDGWYYTLITDVAKSRVYISMSCI